MKNDIGTFRAEPLLSRLASERGFVRLTDYALTCPIATLEQMSEDLGTLGVAPIHLQWLLLNEALAAGDLERCARDLLAREIHSVAGGWPASRGWDDQARVRNALVAWQTAFQEPPYGEAANAITDALLDAEDIPGGWKPGSANDPRLVELFQRFWPRRTT